MERANNYSVAVTPYGRELEYDSFTCFHCQQIMMVKPRQKPEDLGGLCKVCMQLICPACVGKMTCDPWQKKMERMEAKDRFLRQAGI